MNGKGIRLLFLIAGTVLFLGVPACFHAQLGEVVLHQPTPLQSFHITVTVRSFHDGEKEPGAILRETKAIGFSAGGCDVVTTFDAVEYYERWNYRPDMKATISAMVGGKPYEGILRPMGVYPNGFDLACVDLLPRDDGEIPVLFPLEIETAFPKTILYEGSDLSSDDIGTPLLDGKNRVVAVLAGGYASLENATPRLQVVSGNDLRRFLRFADEFNSRRRLLAGIPR